MPEALNPNNYYDIFTRNLCSMPIIRLQAVICLIRIKSAVYTIKADSIGYSSPDNRYTIYCSVLEP